MRGWLVGSVVAAVVAGVCVGLAPTTAGPSVASRDPGQLDAYTVTATASELAAITEQGFVFGGN